MTVRDPYTGVERLAPSRPRSFVNRWWPIALFAAIAVAGGAVEWRNSIAVRAPHPVPAASAPIRAGATNAPPSIAQPPAGAATPLATGSAATTPQVLESNDITVALAALSAASDRLSSYALLLIIVAALQAIVLICQLYLFGQQLQAARNKPK